MRTCGQLDGGGALTLICAFCTSYVDIILNIFVIVTFAVLIAYVLKIILKTAIKGKKTHK